MNIDNSLVKAYGGYLHQYTNSLASVSRGRVGELNQGQRDDDDSVVNLSNAAKGAKTEKTDVNLEKPLQSGDSLNLQVISQMVKRITGQDLQLTPPSQLQNQVGGLTVQAPQQSPPATSNQAGSPTYQQSTSYFEAQSITFNAEGSISTQDGQNVKFSVSLSMSRLFYNQANINAASGDAGTKDPLQVSFDGMAAELTTTSFNFSIDNKGSVDQVATNPKLAPAVTAAPVSGQIAGDNTTAGLQNSGTQNTTQQDDPFGSLVNAVTSFFNALQIWQHHADGSQQLLALGDQSIGAIFLGHVTKPLAADPKIDTLPGVFSKGSIVVPEPSKPSTTPQINTTA